MGGWVGGETHKESLGRGKERSVRLSQLSSSTFSTASSTLSQGCVWELRSRFLISSLSSVSRYFLGLFEDSWGFICPGTGPKGNTPMVGVSLKV